MFKKNLIIILILFSNILYAEDVLIKINASDLNTRLNCSEASFKHLDVINSSQVYSVYFGNLYTTDIITDTLVCQRFIRDLKGYLRENSILSLDFEIEEKKKSITGKTFYQFKDTTLLDICIKLGLCNNNIGLKNNIDKKLFTCRSTKKVTDIFKDLIPSKNIGNIKNIKDIDIDIFPFKSFSERAVEFSNKNNNSENVNFYSSMTMGQGTAQKLSKSLTGNNQLILDAGLMFLNDDYFVFSKLFKNNLKIQPIIPGADFKTVHHWKYGFSSANDNSFITSMNLATPQKAPYVDLIYNFEDPDIKKELVSLDTQAKNTNCKNKKQFDCLINFIGTGIENNYLKECKIEKTFKTKNKYIANNIKFDLYSLITNYIKSAKEEIVIGTHQFSSEIIAKELIAAKKRGVKVYVFASINSPIKDLNFRDSFYFTKNDKLTNKFIDPHFKLIIKDRKEVLFGSGNFTINALENAREMYLKSDSKEFIKKLLFIFNSYAKFFKIDSFKELLEDIKGDQLVILNNLFNNNKKLPHTSRFKNNSNYLLIDNSFKNELKKCSLNNKIFISEADFINCYSSIMPKKPSIFSSLG